jgi:hypothetical protein
MPAESTSENWTRRRSVNSEIGVTLDDGAVPEEDGEP